MKLPKGKTEAEVFDAIEKVVAILAPKSTFGYYDVDDLRQQGWVFALEVLDKEKYDGVRPLANFLYVHLKNRFLNYKRDKLRRNDPPCKDCHAGKHCTPDGKCKKYVEWVDRNNAKANILKPLDINHVSDENERNAHVNSTVSEEVEVEEIVRLIDEKLSMELRPTYLQMRTGMKVSRARREPVEQAIREILRGEDVCLPKLES